MRLTNLLSSLNPFIKTRKRKRNKVKKFERKSKMNRKIKSTKRRFKMRGGWGGDPVPSINTSSINSNLVMKGGWGCGVTTLH